MKILIPARAGSKGFPYKNRKLLRYTLDTIPADYLANVVVSTDDEEIKKVLPKGVEIHQRSSDVSEDTSSIWSVVSEVVKGSEEDEDIIMLYLTYPERRWQHVIDAYQCYLHAGASSLLCRQPVKSHPYLCMIESSPTAGKQIIPHNLHRRQDYPECFELSHYICIFNISELKNLNNNMYNKNTYFYKIGDVVDVDYEEELKKVSLWL